MRELFFIQLRKQKMQVDGDDDDEMRWRMRRINFQCQRVGAAF